MHKADLQRILISITNVDYDRDIADLKDKIEKSYKRAVEICQEIDDLSSIKAGIILHYCIYVFEDNKDVSTAYNKANELYQNANRLLNKVKNKDIHKELINLLIVLKQNIDIWSNKLASNETVDNVNIQSQDIK